MEEDILTMMRLKKIELAIGKGCTILILSHILHRIVVHSVSEYFGISQYREKEFSKEVWKYRDFTVSTKALFSKLRISPCIQSLCINASLTSFFFVEQLHSSGFTFFSRFLPFIFPQFRLERDNKETAFRFFSALIKTTHREPS